MSAAPKFPWLWFAVAVIAATVWTAVALTQNNLELQSIDLCHHVMFVDHLQSPWGKADREFVGAYPLLSHRVAALWLPLFDNPIQAVRAAALASLLIMLIAQWFLFRTLMSPAPALIALILWQSLCTNCKLGDVNHFLWDFQYNFSRAMAAAALWVMLLGLVVPPFRHRVFNLVLLLGLAGFAFRCHIAAGSLALATLGTWCIVQCIRRNWYAGVVGLIALTGMSAGLLIFTDEWRYLASLSHDNGPLPIRHPDLIALWIPTALIGFEVALRKAYRTLRGQALPMDFTVAVLCGLLPAAALQSYMLYGKNISHTIGTYPYNQMLFYTFALATLLWMAGLLAILKSWAPQLIARGNSILSLLAIASAAWGLYTILEADARRPRPEPDRDPIRVLNALKPLRESFVGHYYYDPALEHASYFVTRAVLGRESHNAPRYRLHLHQRRPWDLFREPELLGVFLPLTIDPVTIFGPGCPTTRSGDFWRCDLAAFRTSGELEVAARQREFPER